MNCPCCQSDNLEQFEEGTICSETTLTSQCCEDCGASFHLINPPQPVLLEDIQKNKFRSAKDHILAKGMKGILLDCGAIFRVKVDTKEGFQDYDINIDDMSIIIDDDDAFIKGETIDYSDQTLGIE